jgi:probable F420-dependent oxidoreductase
VPDHDPIVLAKRVATLDQISNGRFIFGIGGGWCHEEVANHGVDPAQRWKVMRERILAMKQIWTQDEAEYHGEFVNFDPIWSWPKPVQKPHPPIIVAGEGIYTLRRTVDYGDGWFPVLTRSKEPVEVSIDRPNQMAAAAGRGKLSVTVNGGAETIDAIEQLAKAGVERCNFRVPDHPLDATLSRLDELAKLAERV